MNQKLMKFILITMFSLSWEFYDYIFTDPSIILSFGLSSTELIFVYFFIISERIFILYLFTWIYDHFKEVENEK